MVELAISINPTRADIVNALRMKSQLLDEGVKVKSIVLNDNSGTIPLEFLEDLIQLQVMRAPASEEGMSSREQEFARLKGVFDTMRDEYQDGSLTLKNYMYCISKIEQEIARSPRNN